MRLASFAAALVFVLSSVAGPAVAGFSKVTYTLSNKHADFSVFMLDRQRCLHDNSSSAITAYDGSAYKLHTDYRPASFLQCMEAIGYKLNTAGFKTSFRLHSSDRLLTKAELVDR